MGYTVLHGACPYCQSSDGYCEYDDGGHHCFSCGHHYGANPYVTLKQGVCKSAGDPVYEKDIGCSPLPDDVFHLLGSGGVPKGMNKAVSWLKKYSITNAEIDKHDLLWSETKELLIFPVYDDSGCLLMWQGRFFGTNPKHPKYLTRGKPDTVLHIIGKDKQGPLVLTEDLISAIKVGRHCPAMPLWGSHLSVDVARRISTQYKEARIWLDYDKRQTAVKLAFEHCMRLHIEPIITTHDPKCHSDEEIHELLFR